MQQFEAFKEKINSPQKIVITTHPKPDADALGSSLGLGMYLQKKGHQVDVVSPTDFPNFLSWMKGADKVWKFDEEKQKTAIIDLVQGADMIFCLDFSNISRLDDLGEVFKSARASKVLIDHHLEPEKFADFEYWSTEAAATCELVYELIEKLGDKEYIDKDMADCLYAGIMTDTGSFRHPNTTKNVHQITAELIDLGVDTSKVGKLVYDSNSLNRLKFIGFALSERLEVLPDYHVAYFCISKEDQDRFASRTGDTEGLVNYALSIEGITLAAILIEKDDMVKMSFRSVNDFPANELAKLHFEGGGHKNAAGGKSSLSLEATLAKLKGLLPTYKELLEANTTQNIQSNV